MAIVLRTNGVVERREWWERRERSICICWPTAEYVFSHFGPEQSSTDSSHQARVEKTRVGFRGYPAPSHVTLFRYEPPADVSGRPNPPGRHRLSYQISLNSHAAFIR